MNKLNENEKNDNKMYFVVKLNEEQIKKIQNISNPVVCLKLPKNEAVSINNKIIFIDEESYQIGEAFLVKLITAPKENIWNEIKNFTYLNESEFKKIYADCSDSTISVVYDFKLLKTNKKIVIKSNDFDNQISFAININ